jgi:hypothetical protein
MLRPDLPFSLRLCLAAGLLLLSGATAWPATIGDGGQMVAVTEFSYTAGPEETSPTARALALFGAKYEAVVECADKLTAEGLLEAEAGRKKAILCLVADAIRPQLLTQSADVAHRVYTVKLRSICTLADYVKAEIRNESLDKEEGHFTLKEDLEPVMAPAITPALELSRAYRYIVHERWRMAIIYLEHLESKYPHWGPLYLAKATAFLGIHERARAVSSMASACHLGVQEACAKIDLVDSKE